MQLRTRNSATTCGQQQQRGRLITPVVVALAQVHSQTKAAPRRIQPGSNRSKVPTGVVLQHTVLDTLGLPTPSTTVASPPVPTLTSPPPAALASFRNSDCVCFDVDCTIVKQDSLDLLAEFMGCKDEVEELTNQAMDGNMELGDSLEQRLNLINCTPQDIRRFIQAHPPATRLVPGVKELIKTLQARGVAVYLISGGFRELTLPIAAHLGVPKNHVFANRMQWVWDDETGTTVPGLSSSITCNAVHAFTHSGMPTKLAGFDTSEPTARNKGKVEAISIIRQNNPYNNITMIGDGITDLEAVQASHGADLFIGFGGVVERPAVAAAADWFVYDYPTLLSALKRYKVACVGSGAWACAAARMVAQNTTLDDPADQFVDEVAMWVHEEQHEGRKLSEVMNGSHENPRYLPGVHLGDNIVAVPDIVEAVKDADCIIMCVPHQFMHNVCKQLSGKVKPDAMVISLTKGMRVRPEGPQLISAMVRKYLGTTECCVLMGGNLAHSIAKEELSEAVIGYTNLEHARMWQKLFQRPYFNVELLPDVVGAEMCGTLKNVVAVAAGMVDGLGYGANTKAAILRQGLEEMRGISKALYPSVRDSTFLQTCGIGDLICTCFGGRNRLVSEAWTKANMSGKSKTFEQLEKELLNGQKLQGVLTSNEVQEILRSKGWEQRFPLFTTINRIIQGYLSPDWVCRYQEGALQQVDEGSMDPLDDIVDVPRKHAANRN